ncbi:MAG: ABC transporter ATP-binding protein [Geminicoccaceae bacterium]|nr:ABC transporter ATP-binding protein [Geminicoccaceae bacterium]
MLKIEHLQAAYGQSRVLFDVSLEIREGEIVTLMGRNGMGKTTTVRSVMGLLRPGDGSITFDGKPIAGLVPERIARLGLGLVPEGRQVFPTLTVRENLVATAANRRNHPHPWVLDRVFELFPRMRERAGQSAGTLSGGEQQMLAIGRALMTNPRLLILDEATEGLAPVIRGEIWHCIRHLKAEGQSILLIDKNLAVLEHLADRHYILEKGYTVWNGSSNDLHQQRDSVQAHVGI